MKDQHEKQGRDESIDFLIEQYKALRTEIDQTMAHSRQLIFATVVACGALWSFILLNRDISVGVLYWIPFIISVFGCYYSLALRNNLKKISVFIAKIEKELLNEQSKSLGWESHFWIKGQNWRSSADRWEDVFWFSLLILNIFGAILIEPIAVHCKCCY